MCMCVCFCVLWAMLPESNETMNDYDDRPARREQVYQNICWLLLLSQVLLARHKAEQQFYAIKVLNKSNVLRKNETTHVMAERNVLICNVHHPFLIGLHYSFQTPDKLYFVVDYVNGGEVM